MSAYASYTTDFRDRDCLVAAIQDLGYKPVVSDEPINLEGYQGDKRKNLANVVIPRKQWGAASNDIGFLLNEEGIFEAVVSSYDTRKFNTQLDRLKLEYNKHLAVSKAKNAGAVGIKVTKREVNGKISYRLRAGVK